MQSICKFGECTRSAHWKNDGKRGWCNVHYRRWQRHGDPSICKYAPDGSGCIYKGYKILNIKGQIIPEHRYKMQIHLGRKLNQNEVIHHINGNSLDNQIDNLEIMTQNIHAKIHAHNRYSYLDIKCDHCNKVFRSTAWRIKNNKHNYCCKKCSHNEKKINGKSYIKHYFRHFL